MAFEAGINDRQLRRRDVVRLSRDTYLPRAVAEDLGTRIDAVLMTAPEGAVVSHTTAAAMWKLQLPFRSDDDRIHLTVSTGSAVRARADRSIHRCPLVDEEVTTSHGVRITTPPRTWRDLATMLPPAALLAVSDQLLARHCSADDLARQLALRPDGRGAARAREVLPLADARAQSPQESVLRWMIHEAGLPAPEMQHVIRSQGGAFVGQTDLAWPDKLVLVEFDGDLHRERDVFVQDLRRQNGLVAAGWTVLRFSSADLYGRPDYVIAAIRAALR